MPVLVGAEPFSHDGDVDVAVLLCHDVGGSPSALLPWARHLAGERMTVRLPRLPGHGTSPDECAVTRWDDWFGAAERDFRGLRRTHRTVVVGGLAAGGALALRLAQEHGADVAGLVLVNPAVTGGGRLLPPWLARRLPSVPRRRDDAKRPGVSEVGYDRVPRTAAASLAGAWRTVVRDLPDVIQPLLLYRSAEDHVVPAASTALILSRVSSTDVTEVVLHDSYHLATLDHDAETVFEGSAGFADRLATAARTP